jgi:hypothetical protein
MQPFYVSFDTKRYATERGGIHSWDLRAKVEPFVLRNKPNLGISLEKCFVLTTPFSSAFLTL